VRKPESLKTGLGGFPDIMETRDVCSDVLLACLVAMQLEGAALDEI
jgi:hypothetical protein